MVRSCSSPMSDVPIYSGLILFISIVSMIYFKLPLIHFDCKAVWWHALTRRTCFRHFSNTRTPTVTWFWWVVHGHHKPLIWLPGNSPATQICTAPGKPLTCSFDLLGSILLFLAVTLFCNECSWTNFGSWGILGPVTFCHIS